MKIILEENSQTDVDLASKHIENEILPMTSEVLERVEKRLGSDISANIEAEVKNWGWMKEYVTGSKVRQPSMETDKDVHRLQAVQFYTANLQFCLGTIVLCESEYWTMKGDDDVNTGVLAIFSNYIRRSKSHYDFGISLWDTTVRRKEENIGFSTKAVKRDSKKSFLRGKLPATFGKRIDDWVMVLKKGRTNMERNNLFTVKSTLPVKSFEKALSPSEIEPSVYDRNNNIEAKYLLLSGQPHFSKIKTKYESAVTNKLQQFNVVLEDLFKKNVYKGIAEHEDSSIPIRNYLAKQLLADPTSMQALYKSHEKSTGDYLLEELSKREEEVAEFQAFNYKIAIRVFKPSEKIYCTFINEDGKAMQQWFLSYADFKEAFGDEVHTKMAILDVSMPTEPENKHDVSKNTPFIVETGVAVHEKHSWGAEKIEESRTYYLHINE